MKISNIFKSIFSLLVLCLSLNACSNDNGEIIPRNEIKDIKNLPQDALAYTTDTPNDSEYFIAKISTQEYQNTEDLRKALAKDYIQKFTSPWYEEANPNMDEVFWILPSLLSLAGFDALEPSELQKESGKLRLDDKIKDFLNSWHEAAPKKATESKDKTNKEKPKFYSEDLQEINPEFVKKVIKNMDLNSYLCESCPTKRAIITSTTDVRALPTNKPLFNKINGYPFDRWQNSLIFANTPVLITHTSRDGRWVHIQSSYIYGWVEAESLGLMSEKQIDEFASRGFFVPILDKIPIQIQEQNETLYLGEARIGQLFPAFEHYKSHSVLTIYKRDSNGRAIPKHFNTYNFGDLYGYAPFPLWFRDGKIAAVIDTMLGQKYGWGGYLENRDCSAFIRDIFTQFGLHLPRNSKAQVDYGKNEYNHEVISLKDLSSEEKEAYIIKHATPFKTILWQSGHIMLYIGHKDGRALIAHSAWSVTTGERFENLLGGVVITSLHVGEERNSSFATSPLLIDKIEAMSDLSSLSMLIQNTQEISESSGISK